MRKYCKRGGAMKPMVSIKVKGYNLDQLLNKLHNENITCYNIVRESTNVVFVSIRFKDYGRVKPLLKNYEYHIKYLGLANFKQFLIKNLAVIIMLPIAVALISFSTKFIWNIKVYGGGEVLQQDIVAMLNSHNIKVGKTDKLSNSEIENLIISNLPNVAQVSCIKRGTTLIINISEKLVYAPESYEPIRATHNGIITNFSLISGTMAVNIGDFVSAGDILVYPFTLDKAGKQVSVKPIAEVRAKAYIVGSSKLNATSTELVRTGETYTTSSMRFLNKNLFSKKLPKPFALYETSVYNQYISSVLPIVKTTVTYYELDYVLVDYDLNVEQPKVEQQSIDLAYKNLPTNSEILDQQTSSLVINDCLYSTTTLTISTIIS